MPINTETLNRRLFKVLHQRFKNTTPLDSGGEKTPVEDEADVFKFTFTKDGEEYGTVFATIDDNKKLKIYNGDDVIDSPEAPTPGLGYDDTWFGFLKFLKSWAMQNQLGWDIENKDHLEGDMARRDHMKKKESIAEGYYPMGKKASYSDSVPTVKMIIQHSREIQEGEQRYRNVARIFLENSQGERILAPTTKPGVAKVYARHIAEGGLPNDERWNHIKGLCEEYNKMAGFVRATRGQQFNESAQQLVESGIQHYNKLRESLSRMTGHRGYNMYFESWTPPLMEDDTDTSSLNELFVQETLDPRIESVMPILSKLHKTVAEMKEVDALAEWADSLLEGEGGPEASEETDGDTAGDAGEGGAEDAPEDDLSEAAGAETLAHNEKTVKGNLDAFDLDEGDGGQQALNPIGIPEGEEGTPQSHQAQTTLKHLKKASYGDRADAANIKSGIAGFRDRIDMLQRAKDEGNLKDEEVDESALQAYLGDKKYGKDGMDALRKAGQEHASEKKMQNIRAKFSNKEKEVDEDLDANQKRVGQLGPTEKVKNNNIGKLVGANENFINTDAQAVVSEEETTTHKGGTVTKKDGVTKHKSAPGVYGGHDPSRHPDSPEEKHPEPRGRKTGHDTDQIKKFKFSEGQEDLEAIKRLLGK